MPFGRQSTKICYCVFVSNKENTMSKLTTKQQTFLFLADLTINPNIPASVQLDALKLQTKMGTYTSMRLNSAHTQSNEVTRTK